MDVTKKSENRIAKLTEALKALRPYFGKLKTETPPVGTSFWDRARQAFEVLDDGDDPGNQLPIREERKVWRESDGQEMVWRHCSPELLAGGVDCATTPRSICYCPFDGSHDHLVPADESRSEEARPLPKKGEWIAYAERFLEALRSNEIDLQGTALEYVQLEYAVQQERHRIAAEARPETPLPRDVLVLSLRAALGNVRNYVATQPAGDEENELILLIDAALAMPTGSTTRE